MKSLTIFLLFISTSSLFAQYDTLQVGDTVAWLNVSDGYFQKSNDTIIVREGMIIEYISHPLKITSPRFRIIGEYGNDSILFRKGEQIIFDHWGFELGRVGILNDQWHGDYVQEPDVLSNDGYSIRRYMNGKSHGKVEDYYYDGTVARTGQSNDHNEYGVWASYDEFGDSIWVFEWDTIKHEQNFLVEREYGWNQEGLECTEIKLNGDTLYSYEKRSFMYVVVNSYNWDVIIGDSPYKDPIIESQNGKDSIFHISAHEQKENSLKFVLRPEGEKYSTDKNNTNLIWLTLFGDIKKEEIERIEIRTSKGIQIWTGDLKLVVQRNKYF